ncbi:MAG: GNAT family N-acetyltransferase [Anaerolineae bacterium]|jgi:ribosomal protein S18 acetylase RimI-like enzyme
MDMVIRTANEDDLPEMLRLWREMMDFHARCDARFRPRPLPEAEQAWTKYLREDIWDSDRWCILVAEADDALVGQIGGELREAVPVFEPRTYGYITDIVVDPAARRRGIGRALFKALEEWFRGRGAADLQLQVLESNPAAQAFWRAMGCSDYSDILWYDLEAE